MSDEAIIDAFQIACTFRDEKLQFCRLWICCTRMAIIPLLLLFKHKLTDIFSNEAIKMYSSSWTSIGSAISLENIYNIWNDLVVCFMWLNAF